MTRPATPTLNPQPLRLTFTICMAVLLGVALLYLIGIALELESLLMQHLMSQPWVSSSLELRGLVLHLPYLSLAPILLSYLLGYLALHISDRQRLLHAAAFITPVFFSSAWWSYQLCGKTALSALSGMVGGTHEVLSMLAMVLAVLLAYHQVARQRAA